MHLYFGWICQTPNCGEEILYQYLGEEPLRKNIEVNAGGLLFVKCRKCKQTHEYSQRRPDMFRRATRESWDQEPS